MELLVAGYAALGIRLDQVQIDQFHQYYQEIVEWNKRVNLTSVTALEQVQTRLFLGSLAVSSALPSRLLSKGGKILDLGAGAGLPGLPLKIAFPRLRVTLMDATAKKTTFLTHVTQVLGLEDVEICTGRAETLAHDPKLRESFDAVLSRAVARLPALSELSLPFCCIGGLVIAQKSAGIEDEIREAKRAIEVMGGALKEVKEVAFQGSAEKGVLVLLEKTSPTPGQYPRRPGIPSKRPL